jgi:hypothetical protein
MSSNTLDYGYKAEVSRTLQPGDRSFDTILWQQGKPPLDSELNLQFDIISEKVRSYIESQCQSGFINLSSYQFEPLTLSNQFKMSKCIALINGWQINVNGFGSESIKLNPAFVGNGAQRWDFVFLEVWKTIISGNSIENKPAANTVYRDGNVQNLISIMPDDIIDQVVNLETTKRVQIQYRIRIQEDVESPNSQNSNLFDSSTFARGGANLPVDPYVFTNQGITANDYGLWKAGNGDNASRAQLNTVDGFVYAIPLAFVFRRSQSPYIDEDIDGKFASNTQISSGISDRIDGLFYDSVDENDVIDLRHKTILNDQIDYTYLFKSSIQDLLTGKNLYNKPIDIKYEAVSDVAISGYTILNGNNICDGIRSAWSDLAVAITSHVIRINIGDVDTNRDYHTSRASGNWQIGDTITIKVPNGSPSGSVILGTNDSTTTTKPFVFRNQNGLLDIMGSWAGIGTNIAIFTIDENIGNQQLWICYDIQYPSNQGLSYIPEEILKLDYTNIAAFPILQSAYTAHTGIVRVGTNLLNQSLAVSRESKQLYYSHISNFNNYASNFEIKKRNKEINITPIISTTTTVGGGTRTMSVKNYNSVNRRLSLPFKTNKIWFIRGVYTDQTGGNEVATEVYYDENPALVSGQVFQHPRANYSFAQIISIVFDPLGIHQELIVTSGGNYWPVFRQDSIGNINQFLLVDNDGNVFDPPSPNAADYQITHRSIPTAKASAYTVNSLNPKDNFIQIRNDPSLVDGQTLWIDIDYIGEPHDGAQVKLAYKYQPYQGMINNDGLELFGQIKKFSGFVHSDGTGNINVCIDPVAFPQTLTAHFPMPLNVEYMLNGGSVSGIGQQGMYGNQTVCYVTAEILDYSTAIQKMLKVNDIISGQFNILLNAVERGGNDATDLKSVMLQSLSAANYKQVVIFGLVLTKDNFLIKNELMLYIWTYTNNDSQNILTSADILHVGVDFVPIKFRPLVKVIE